MKLVIAEKTSLKKKIAAGLAGITLEEIDTINKVDGDYSCPDNFLISGLEGHIIDPKEPHEYNEIWKDRSAKTLPIIINDIEYKEPVQDYRLSKYLHMKELIPKVTEIYHCGDPDREGQAIVDNILSEFNLNVPVYRIWLTDLSNIPEAFKNKELNNSSKYINLRYSARARTIADWLIGMNYSRALTTIFRVNGYDVNISIGRIQTPTLKLVVDRYNTVNNFKKKYHYSLTAQFKVDESTFTADLVFDESLKQYLDEDGQLTDKSVIERIQNEIKNSVPVVSSYKVTTKKETAPLPYTTAKIMSEAVKKYGYSLAEVGDILQSLYENDAIDYPRTDYEYLSEKAYIEKAPGKLEQLKKLPQFANATPDYSIKSRAWDDSKLKAHEGITPILTGYLSQASEAEINVFNLIAIRFLIQFYPDYEFDNTVIQVKVGNYTFISKSNTPKVMGWKKLYIEDTEADEEDKAIGKLPELKNNQTIDIIDSTIKNKETKPPKLFTEDTLITAMTNVANYIDDIVKEYEAITGEAYCDNVEEYKKILRHKPDEGGGLGTGATQPGIIKTLLDRDFIYKNEKSQLIPSNIGIMIINFFKNKEIIKNYSFLTNPITSASYEKLLTEIADGRLTFNDFVNKFVNDTIVDKVVGLQNYAHLLPKNPEAQACPICGNGFLMLKQYRDKETKELKEYFGCTNHPDCKAYFSVLNGKPNLIKTPRSEHKCPKCETGYLIKKVSIKDGKEFTWYFCSSYKDGCEAKYYDKNGKPDLNAKPKVPPKQTGEKCPKCGDGNLIIREGYSEKLKKKYEMKCCDGYPKCDYKAKEKPKLSFLDKMKSAT